MNQRRRLHDLLQEDWYLQNVLKTMTLKMQLLVSVVAHILDNLQMNKERIRLDGLPLFFRYTYFICTFPARMPALGNILDQTRHMQSSGV